MIIRSWMSLIMGLIGLEQLELLALGFEKLLHLTLFTLALASTIINQLEPNLIKIYMIIRYLKSSIIGLIK